MKTKGRVALMVVRSLAAALFLKNTIGPHKVKVQPRGIVLRLAQIKLRSLLEDGHLTQLCLAEQTPMVNHRSSLALDCNSTSSLLPSCGIDSIYSFQHRRHFVAATHVGVCHGQYSCPMSPQQKKQLKPFATDDPSSVPTPARLFTYLELHSSGPSL